MGIILEILTSESFRKRPAMYVGSARFAAVMWWLAGLEFGCRKALSDQPYELDGFREWLHMRLEGPGNTDWLGIIAWKFGTEDDATQKVFEYLDQFLQDVAKLGVNQIVANHADYERQRYGFLTSSRLAKQD